jgi:dTDP-4-amino-4,6-dideoxygalactose transaminase
MTEDHPAILAGWREVLESGTFVNGQQLETFEHELAGYLGVRHAIGVSSGTDALTLILRSVIRPGDEVIVPALTFIATAEAVVHAGGVPVFCDVDPDSWVLTAETVHPQLTGKAAAILPVHLFGNPAPMGDLVDRFGIPVVEDACQAIGSTYRGAKCGSLGDAAAFSFYPSKTLAGLGDGGAVTTNDDTIAETVRLLRHHGSRDGRRHELVGGTHRLDELQAAALRIRLASLPERLATQRDRATVASSRGIELQRTTFGGESSWHRIVTCDEPRGRGRFYYDPPCHQQPSMAPYWRCDLPNAERFGRTNVCVSPE